MMSMTSVLFRIAGAVVVALVKAFMFVAKWVAVAVIALLAWRAASRALDRRIDSGVARALPNPSTQTQHPKAGTES